MRRRRRGTDFWSLIPPKTPAESLWVIQEENWDVVSEWCHCSSHLFLNLSLFVLLKMVPHVLLSLSLLFIFFTAFCFAPLQFLGQFNSIRHALSAHRSREQLKMCDTEKLNLIGNPWMCIKNGKNCNYSRFACLYVCKFISCDCLHCKNKS